MSVSNEPFVGVFAVLFGMCCFFVGAGVPLVSGRFQLGGAEAFIVLRFWEWGSRLVFGMSQACSKIVIDFLIAFV